MRRIPWLCLACLALGPTRLVHAQADDVPAVSYPQLPELGDTPDVFVPPRWKLEQLLTQDFDRDGRSDALLLLRMQSEDNVIRQAEDHTTLDSNPRMLVGLLGTGTQYRLLFSNHALIPRHDSTAIEDPFAAVRLEPGGFVVALKLLDNVGAWWTSQVSFRFHYRDNCFRLIGYDKRASHRASGERDFTTVNFLTRKREVAQTLGRRSVRYERVASSQPICIETISDGFEFAALSDG